MGLLSMKGSSNFVNLPLGNSGVPVDVGNVAYIIYFALGAGFLLPWNAVITAVDYFDFLYPNTHIDRVFSIAYMFPCLIGVLLLSMYGRHFTAWSRINGGLILFLITIVLMPVMDMTIMSGKRGSSITHILTVLAVAVTGVADALVQGSLVGSAGQLPERYMQAVVSGTAASGCLASGLRILTKACLPQTPHGLRISANIYFLVSAGFLVLCLVSYNLVEKLPIIRYYCDMQTGSTESTIPDEENVAKDRVLFRRVSSSGQLAAAAATASVTEPLVKEPKESVSYGKVFWQIKWFSFGMVTIYVMTLSIFPGYLAEDVHSATFGDWYPVLLIAAYNLLDLAGKTLTAYYIFEKQSYIVAGCFGRLIFYPLFALCLHGPKSFRTEVPVFVLTALLGASNGYFTSNLMVVAPKVVKLPEAETAGMIIVFFLVLGLAIGCLVSWVWVI